MRLLLLWKVEERCSSNILRLSPVWLFAISYFLFNFGLALHLLRRWIESSFSITLYIRFSWLITLKKNETRKCIEFNFLWQDNRVNIYVCVCRCSFRPFKHSYPVFFFIRKERKKAANVICTKRWIYFFIWHKLANSFAFLMVLTNQRYSMN